MALTKIPGSLIEASGNLTITDLTVTGDLSITGDLNSYNVTDLDVVDQTITLGAGQTEALSGGSGIIIDGSSASILWDETNDVFDFNKGLTTLGNLGIGCTPTGYATEIQATTGGNALKLRGRSAAENAGWLAWTDNADNVEAAMYATANNLIFANTTSYTERMRIDSSGNVGIGTNNPTAKLDVSGDGTWIRHSGYGQLLDMGNWTDGLVRIESTGAPMYIRAAGSNYMAFDTNSVERLRIDSDGKLLVGATSNTSRGGSATKALIKLGTGESYFDIQASSTSANSDILFSDASGGDYGILGYQHSTDSMLFYTASTERMRIDSSGNVGIGSNSPTSYYEGADNLVVLGTDEAGITVVTPDNRTGALYFADGTTSAERYKGGIAYQHANDTLILVSGGASKVAIDENGYVGIGDLSPAHKLEIQSLDNYKAVHIKGTNAPCYTMARGTGSDAEWRMGLSGYDYEDFAISAGTGTGDKFRIDPNGNSWQGSVNNYTPRDGLHDIGQTASFNGPIASGYAEGPGGNGAAPIIHDWFVYSSANSIGSNNYVHMKTNLLGGATGVGNQDFTMSCFTYHNYYGYGSNYYGYGVIGWHNWNGSFYNVMKNNYGNFNLVQDSYISSDGYVVLVAYIQAAYAQFTIDWAQWAGYSFRQAKVTDVTNTSSATGAY